MNKGGKIAFALGWGICLTLINICLIGLITGAEVSFDFELDGWVDWVWMITLFTVPSIIGIVVALMDYDWLQILLYPLLSIVVNIIVFIALAIIELLCGTEFWFALILFLFLFSLFTAPVGYILCIIFE